MKYLKLILILIVSQPIFSQSAEGNVDNLPVREHTITLRQTMVNKAGKDVMGMTVNGTIPGPTLEFTEGDYAVIYVKNEMTVETSVHWHGLLLPNFQDGVPYLTTPPIMPGQTYKYEFPIRQSGTYWYHSHTMLQEQSGVFGSIVIHPRTENLDYDTDLVLMLSDWTNEKPMSVLRNLKRGNDWYNIKKGTATPLNQVIAQGALGAQFNFWRQRMDGVDIADVYYPAFLINGEESIEYPEFKPGEKVRLRIIDGGASTSFWMTFGGGDPLLVSADGLDVVPVNKNKTFIAIAETYDFIVTIPETGKLEFKITAQDGSGSASAFIGNGEVLPAMDIPKPDKIGMMKKMAKMDMKMGAPALKFNPGKDDRFKMEKEYGMQMENMKGMKMDKSKDTMQMNHPNSNGMDMPKDSMMNEKMDHSRMDMAKDSEQTSDKKGMDGMDMFSEYNYNYLKSPEKTAFNKSIPVKEILLNLTGNMNRYIWSMNGVPISETDNIKIKSTEVTRITFNNLTMMHHPMHLHGHFFRVINENGAYSPLKHTVNVPPMEKVTIEFYGNNGDESGDWFFHCHILYHMMSGMARVMSYDTPRDPRMDKFPVSKIIDETNEYYTWADANLATNMIGLNFTSSNIRNQFNVSAEYGWNKNLEAEVTYQRYLNDYFSVFGGVNVENEIADSMDNLSTTAIVGVNYLTPFLFNLDVSIDSYLRPQISVSREIFIFPRTAIFGSYEYQADFGWVDNLPAGDSFAKEIVWNAGVEYLLSRNFSLIASYDNRFGAGGGLSARF
ncbi:multicopper oxidase domain-containing protein [Formosa sp. PL04]|uniref:multicopper oxidase domain-containing protein n=1 Tax=Formosa sp. PL04 TaxID=3081755 RepID=UPI0029811F9C|nr:multicopper oxidase domain-containing protein [Formosa sp. PL04]MDW5290235.1 multicopper oxidase domain-containing protein [Formosa sp. PL04]